MALQRVHTHSFDKANRAFKIGKTNPIRRFVSDQFIRRGKAEEWKENPKAHHPINWQDGKYYTDAGDQISVEDVPQYILESIATKPPGLGEIHGERILKNCPVCEEPHPYPSPEYEQCLLGHAVRKTANGNLDPELLVGHQRQTRRERRAEATADRTPAAEE